MLTDLHERSDRLKGLEVGVDDYIGKPFDLQEIGLRVRNTIERTSRKRITNPVTGLPEGKPVEDGLQRILLQPEWSIATIRIHGLDSFRAGRGFPAADDMLLATGQALQNAAASQLKVGAMVGHLTFDEFIILSDMPSLLEFAKSIAAKLKETAQGFYPVMAKADPSQPAAEVLFQFRFLSSSDGTFPSLDALQNALDQTPHRTL
jgi:GGDEF domain-containing protein